MHIEKNILFGWVLDLAKDTLKARLDLREMGRSASWATSMFTPQLAIPLVRGKRGRYASSWKVCKCPTGMHQIESDVCKLMNGWLADTIDFSF